MFTEVREILGDPEILVNNAGIALPQKLFTDVTDAEWDRLFDVDVKGIFYCIQAALPAMIRR